MQNTVNQNIPINTANLSKSHQNWDPTLVYNIMFNNSLHFTVKSLDLFKEDWVSGKSVCQSEAKKLTVIFFSNSYYNIPLFKFY